MKYRQGTEIHIISIFNFRMRNPDGLELISIVQIRFFGLRAYPDYFTNLLELVYRAAEMTFIGQIQNVIVLGVFPHFHSCY